MKTKTALIGYGKMGKRIDALAAAANVDIVARYNQLIGANEIEEMKNRQVDVCIDFSSPAHFVSTTAAIANAGINLVAGTTGWHEEMGAVKHIVQSAGIGFLYAPNFSLGVNLFYQILQEVAAIMSGQLGYDAAITESHHNKKLDSPSGTAYAIADILSPVSDHIPISAVRCGHIPGTHSVIFDSLCDTITLTHEARSRDGFALGALEAAKWLRGKQGFFTLNDLLKVQPCKK